MPSLKLKDLEKLNLDMSNPFFVLIPWIRVQCENRGFNLEYQNGAGYVIRNKKKDLEVYPNETYLLKLMKENKHNEIKKYLFEKFEYLNGKRNVKTTG